MQRNQASVAPSTASLLVRRASGMGIKGEGKRQEKRGIMQLGLHGILRRCVNFASDGGLPSRQIRFNQGRTGSTRFNQTRDRLAGVSMGDTLSG